MKKLAFKLFSGIAALAAVFAFGVADAQTGGGYLQRSLNLSDVPNKAVARANLGISGTTSRIISITDISGVVCNDTGGSVATANTTAIAATIATLATTGGVIQIPSGYVCQIATSTRDGVTSRYYAFTPTSNVSFIGPGTIKLADSQTAAGTRDPNIFYKSGGTLDNVRFDNLIVDMNAANNSIPTSGITANSFLQTSETLVTNLMVSNSSFKNHNGSNLLLVNHTVAAATLSRNLMFVNNSFYRVGLSTGDHSTINTFANDVAVVNNYFYNPDADTYPLYIAAPFESHGTNTVFANNRVNNFYKGMMVSQNYTSDANNNLVTGNTFNNIVYAGVEVNAIVPASSSALSINDVVITNNNITFKEEGTNTNAPYRMGLSLLTAQPISNVSFCGNTIARTARTARAIRHLGVYTPQGTDTKSTGRFNNVRICDNIFQNLSLGIFLPTSGSISWVKNVEITANSIYDASDIAAANGYGIYLEGDATYQMNAFIQANRIWDTKGTTSTQYGVTLADYLANFVLRDNVYQNVTTPVTLGVNLITHATTYIVNENPPTLTSVASVVDSTSSPQLTIANSISVDDKLRVSTNAAGTGPSIQGVNNAGNAYAPLNLQGSVVNLAPSGTNALVASSTGIAVTGSATLSNGFTIPTGSALGTGTALFGYYDTGTDTGVIDARNVGVAYKPLKFIGSTITLAPANTAALSATGSGVDITGVLTVSSGGSANAAICWKTGTTLGYCSSIVGAGGTCTCN